MIAESRGIANDELQRKVGDWTLKSDVQVSILQIKQFKHTLIMDGFIEEKPPQTKNNYSTEINLTLWGLFRVLEYVFVQEGLTGSSLKETLDKIAVNQAEKLPLVFKKWQYFDKQGMQEKMIDRLRCYFQFFPDHYTPQNRFLNKLTAAGAKKVTKKDIEFMLFTAFYDWVFLFYPEYDFLPEETMKLWNAMLVRDDGIKQYMIERLRFHRDRILPKALEFDQRVRFFEES